MGKSHIGQLVHQLRTLVRPSAEEEDARLLERFADRQDQEAFAALVHKHGPMVLGVCRRILQDGNDADDAFQATFLVLLRRAGSIGRRELLANWLYGVAYRVARRVRAQRGKRRQRESGVEDLATTGFTSDAASPENALSGVRPVLDDELSRLPEKYRLPIVLCYLQGQTREEAAQRLGWPPGTVAGRLARARDLLRGRLARRGLSLSGVALAALLAEQSTQAALPPALVHATLKTAGLLTAGNVAAGSRAIDLMQAVLHETARNRFAAALAVVLGVVALGGGAVAYYHRTDPPADPSTELARNPNEPPTDLSGEPLPAGAVARLGTNRFRHPGFITAMAFSPQRRFLATAGQTDLCVWDLGTGKQRCRTLLSGEQVQALAVSSDERRLAGCIQNRTKQSNYHVVLWDLLTGREIRRWPVPLLIYGQVTFLPHDQLLATVGQETPGQNRFTLRTWETSTGKQRHHWQSPPDQIAAGFAGDVILSRSFHRDQQPTEANPAPIPLQAVWLWDAATGKELARLPEFRGQHPLVVALSPDHSRLALGLNDRSIRLFDVPSRKEVQRWPVAGALHFLGFSSDGKAVIARGHDGTLAVWDTATGKELRSLHLDRWPLLRARSNNLGLCSPDGRLAAVASIAGGCNRVRLWDTEQGKELFPATGHESTVTQVALVPHANQIVSAGSDRALVLWDSAGKELRRFDPSPAGSFGGGEIVLSADGRRMVSGGMPVCVWDVAAGKLLHRLENVGLPATVALSPDGKTLSWAARASIPTAAKSQKPDGKIVLVDPATGQTRLQWQAHSGSIESLAFSTDGALLASAGPDGLYVWDAATGKQRHRLSGQPQKRLYLASATGELISAGADGSLCWWDLASGKIVRQRPAPTSDCLVFSPDGRIQATASADDPAVIELTDTITGQLLRRLTGHRAAVRALAFSSDGRRLVSGSADTTVLVWNLNH